jgi:hypothetical protein
MRVNLWLVVTCAKASKRQARHRLLRHKYYRFIVALYRWSTVGSIRASSLCVGNTCRLSNKPTYHAGLLGDLAPLIGQKTRYAIQLCEVARIQLPRHVFCFHGAYIWSVERSVGCSDNECSEEGQRAQSKQPPGNQQPKLSTRAGWKAVGIHLLKFLIRHSCRIATGGRIAFKCAFAGRALHSHDSTP